MNDMLIDDVVVIPIVQRGHGEIGIAKTLKREYRRRPLRRALLDIANWNRTTD